MITRVTPGESSLLRSLRLRALETDPLSFGSTYEHEAAFSDEEWRDWATEHSVGHRTATFLARRGDEPVGIVAAFRDDDDLQLFHIVAMWVAPEARRQGVGAELLSHAEGWIRSCGGRLAQLNVTTAADDARRLYSRSGYEEDGERRESRHTRGLLEVSLRKPVA